MLFNYLVTFFNREYEGWDIGCGKKENIQNDTYGSLFLFVTWLFAVTSVNNEQEPVSRSKQLLGSIVGRFLISMGAMVFATFLTHSNMSSSAGGCCCKFTEFTRREKKRNASIINYKALFCHI